MYMATVTSLQHYVHVAIFKLLIDSVLVNDDSKKETQILIMLKIYYGGSRMKYMKMRSIT